MPELLDWLLDATCRQSAAWLQAGLPVTTVAVSLPAQRYRLPALAPAAAGARSERPAPKHLELQIDERPLAAQPVEIDALARRLDDRRAPRARWFRHRPRQPRLPGAPAAGARDAAAALVRALNAKAPATHAIVRASVATSPELGLGTPAEGVEQRGQLDVLKYAGCEEYQGGSLARPMDAGRFEAWLEGARLRPGRSPRRAGEARPEAGSLRPAFSSRPRRRSRTRRRAGRAASRPLRSSDRTAARRRSGTARRAPRRTCASVEAAAPRESLSDFVSSTCVARPRWQVQSSICRSSGLNGWRTSMTSSSPASAWRCSR